MPSQSGKKRGMLDLEIESSNENSNSIRNPLWRIAQFLSPHSLSRILLVSKRFSRNQTLKKALYRQPFSEEDYADLTPEEWRDAPRGHRRWKLFRQCVLSNRLNGLAVCSITLSQWCELKDLRWLQNNCPNLVSLNLGEVRDFYDPSFTPIPLPDSARNNEAEQQQRCGWHWWQIGDAAPQLFHKLQHLTLRDWTDPGAHSLPPHFHDGLADAEEHFGCRRKKQTKLPAPYDDVDEPTRIEPSWVLLKKTPHLQSLTVVIHRPVRSIPRYERLAQIHESVCGLIEPFRHYKLPRLTKLVFEGTPVPCLTEFRLELQRLPNTLPRLRRIQIPLRDWIRHWNAFVLFCEPGPHGLGTKDAHQTAEASKLFWSEDLQPTDNVSLNWCTRDHAKIAYAATIMSEPTSLMERIGDVVEDPDMPAGPRQQTPNIQIVANPYRQHLQNQAIDASQYFVPCGYVKKNVEEGGSVASAVSRWVVQISWLSESFGWDGWWQWGGFIPQWRSERAGVSMVEHHPALIRELMKEQQDRGIPIKVRIGKRTLMPSPTQLFFASVMPFVDAAPLGDQDVMSHFGVVAPLMQELEVSYEDITADLRAFTPWADADAEASAKATVFVSGIVAPRNEKNWDQEPGVTTLESQFWELFWDLHAPNLTSLTRLVVKMPPFFDRQGSKSLEKLLDPNIWELCESVTDCGLMHRVWTKSKVHVPRSPLSASALPSSPGDLKRRFSIATKATPPLPPASWDKGAAARMPADAPDSDRKHIPLVDTSRSTPVVASATGTPRSKAIAIDPPPPPPLQASGAGTAASPIFLPRTPGNSSGPFEDKGVEITNDGTHHKQESPDPILEDWPTDSDEDEDDSIFGDNEPGRAVIELSPDEDAHEETPLAAFPFAPVDFNSPSWTPEPAASGRLLNDVTGLDLGRSVLKPRSGAASPDPPPDAHVHRPWPTPHAHPSLPPTHEDSPPVSQNSPSHDADRLRHTAVSVANWTVGGTVRNPILRAIEKHALDKDDTVSPTDTRGYSSSIPSAADQSQPWGSPSSARDTPILLPPSGPKLFDHEGPPPPVENLEPDRDIRKSLWQPRDPPRSHSNLSESSPDTPAKQGDFEWGSPRLTSTLAPPHTNAERTTIREPGDAFRDPPKPMKRSTSPFKRFGKKLPVDEGGQHRPPTPVPGTPGEVLLPGSLNSGAKSVTPKRGRSPLKGGPLGTALTNGEGDTAEVRSPARVRSVSPVKRILTKVFSPEKKRDAGAVAGDVVYGVKKEEEEEREEEGDEEKQKKKENEVRKKASKRELKREIRREEKQEKEIKKEEHRAKKKKDNGESALKDPVSRVFRRSARQAGRRAPSHPVDKALAEVGDMADDGRKREFVSDGEGDGKRKRARVQLAVERELRKLL